MDITARYSMAFVAYRQVQEGEIQQLRQLVPSQVKHTKLDQAHKCTATQSPKPVACERQFKQAGLCTEGAGLQRTQGIVVQVEVAQGSERCQGSLLQMSDAVVLQEQRLKVVGTKSLLHCEARPNDLSLHLLGSHTPGTVVHYSNPGPSSPT